MNTNKEIIIDENKFFGPLLKYIKDDSITDIDLSLIHISEPTRLL